VSDELTLDAALAAIRAHCAGGEQSLRLEDADANQYDLGPYGDGWAIGKFTEPDGGVQLWAPVFEGTLEACILEAKRRGLL